MLVTLHRMLVLSMLEWGPVSSLLLSVLIFCSPYTVWTCLSVATDNFKEFYCKPTLFDVPMKLNFAGIVTPGVWWERELGIKGCPQVQKFISRVSSLSNK